jgi:hypothetical protein
MRLAPRINSLAADGGSRDMELELESGQVIHNVTEGDILSRVEGEALAILTADTDTYIQCAELKASPGMYVLEFQDGSVDAHYQAMDDPITVDRVLAAFIKYLRDDTSWRTDFRWEQMEL